MTTPLWFAVVFWAFSLLASAFYGWKAFDVFEVATTTKTKEHWGWWVHQIWFNFSGALVGWIAIWVVLQDAWLCLSEHCTANLTWQYGALLSIAFVGVTGHLPFAVSGVATENTEITEERLAFVMKMQRTFWVSPRNGEKPCLSLCSL